MIVDLEFCRRKLLDGAERRPSGLNRAWFIRSYTVKHRLWKISIVITSVLRPRGVFFISQFCEVQI